MTDFILKLDGVREVMKAQQDFQQRIIRRLAHLSIQPYLKNKNTTEEQIWPITTDSKDKPPRPSPKDIRQKYIDAGIISYN